MDCNEPPRGLSIMLERGKTKYNAMEEDPIDISQQTANIVNDDQGCFPRDGLLAVVLALIWTEMNLHSVLASCWKGERLIPMIWNVEEDSMDIPQ
jgi:hypothetical protein